MSGVHTPGPWHVGEHAQLIVYDARGWAIADAKVFHGNRRAGEDFANARLMSAAPDLLTVVHDFRQKLATYVDVYPGDKELRRLLADCDAAIAKATESAE